MSFIPRILLAVCCTSSVPLVAQTTYTWNATTGNWDTPANWTSNVVPVYNQADSIVLSNGVELTPASTTYTPGVDLRFKDISVGLNNSLLRTANGTANLRAVGSFQNEGVIRASQTSGTFGLELFGASGSTLTNSGTIEATGNGGTLNIQATTVNFTNTGGILRSSNGATLSLRTANGYLAGLIGGQIQSGVSSTILVSGDVDTRLQLSNVLVDNQGTFLNRQFQTGAGLSNSRETGTRLIGGTVFTNASTGLVHVLAANTGTSGSETRLDSVFSVGVSNTVGNTASFINNGTLRIQNTSTRANGAVAPQQIASFSVAAGSTFTNTGTVEVFHDTTAVGVRSSAFTSAIAITNEGTVHIRGNSVNEGASFTVSGGQSYTQSGTGLRTLLERGGVLTAGSVLINSGSLGGVGTVTGATTIGSAATLIAADTLADGAGAGVLTFNDNLIFANDSDVSFALGVDTNSSGRITLAGSSALSFGTGLTLNLSDLTGGNWTNGITYRLFDVTSASIVGSLGDITVNTGSAEWSGVLSGGTGFGYIDVTLYSSIPEPSSYAVIASLAVVLATLGSRRRNKI